MYYPYLVIQVRVKPGESALAFYTAENRSSTPITGVSTYNVTPMKVFAYKIRCERSLSTSPCSLQPLGSLCDFKTELPSPSTYCHISMFSSMEHLKTVDTPHNSYVISIRQVFYFRASSKHIIGHK